MSGLIGLISQEPRERKQSEINSMLSKLHHRGPDGQGSYVNGRCALGFTLNRLQSGDAGKMYYEDAHGAVALDGNIYECGTPQDLLELYRAEGPAFLRKVEGPFALIIIDRGKLFAARDHFGIKPLYHAKRESKSLFASELKAIDSGWEDINVLPPGTYFEDKDFNQYYSFPEDLQDWDEISGPQKAASTLHSLLNQSIQKRIENSRSNGSTGIFLSGGLDSSIIAASAASYIEKPRTFATGYTKSEDLEFARQVADHIGADHTEYRYDEAEILEILPKVIYHLESFDQDLVRGSIANYLVARAAKEAGCKTMLCGEGSDELFGGYHYLKDKTESEIEEELYRIAGESHHMAFQRVDRMCSAHALETEMPFIDRNVVEFAFSIPVEWKIHGQEKTEKWVLRKAFAEDLPSDVVWRKKEQFSKGAGSSDVLAELAEEKISDTEFEQSRELTSDFQLQSKEELFYYRIFREFYPQDEILDTFGRWENA